ncbi:UDP-N-acetylmuramate dehydrogenase [Diplocloster modestus]|uniref:UDP-N-acetylenolpyruvoylglucosamine reductase n=1 Tax=Diplocloster modestus TaxID=2850322 RepID=A0ABS6K644_9FIRM|nr:UDP-N-acetylmuramate dehydrogenase [Diplocloster modestus]
MNQEFYNQISQIVGSDSVKLKEAMKKHTTFRVGGPADYFITPHTIQEIQQTIRICNDCKIPYYILGNGSNLLVSDTGYRGAVIQVFQNLDQIRVQGTHIAAQAGVLLSRLAKRALEEGLGGLEFAAGIPGTVGGASVMNAGAYGGELKDVCTAVTMLTPQGELRVLTRDEMEFGYRTSAVAKEHGIVVESEFELTPREAELIRGRMEKLQKARSEKQPLEYPSAGSTFKRPEGYFAGKLIMDAGLRGCRIGDAQVSEKHCGFVINRGSATASQIMQLIRHIQAEVKEQFGVTLETEVKTLGCFEGVD